MSTAQFSPIAIPLVYRYSSAPKGMMAVLVIASVNASTSSRVNTVFPSLLARKLWLEVNSSSFGLY
jgi:hypothetical protein